MIRFDVKRALVSDHRYDFPKVLLLIVISRCLSKRKSRTGYYIETRMPQTNFLCRTGVYLPLKSMARTDCDAAKRWLRCSYLKGVVSCA